MSLHRRTLLKEILFISASLTIIPSCLFNDNKKGILLKHLSVSADQEATFATLFDTILPETETPGALKVHADLFAWKMLDDCSLKSDMEIILKGLNDLNSLCQSISGNVFYKLTLEQREKILKEIDLKKDKNNTLFEFFQKAKSLAIYGFISSEYFMTNVEKYEQIPGRFLGCVQL